MVGGVSGGGNGVGSELIGSVNTAGAGGDDRSVGRFRGGVVGALRLGALVLVVIVAAFTRLMVSLVVSLLSAVIDLLVVVDAFGGDGVAGTWAKTRLSSSSESSSAKSRAIVSTVDVAGRVGVSLVAEVANVVGWLSRSGSTAIGEVAGAGASTSGGLAAVVAGSVVVARGELSMITTLTSGAISSSSERLESC